MFECQPFKEMCYQEKWYNSFPVICTDTGAIPAGEPLVSSLSLRFPVLPQGKSWLGFWSAPYSTL